MDEILYRVRDVPVRLFQFSTHDNFYAKFYVFRAQ